MVSKKDSNKARLQRHKRVRAKINGTADRPRLDVFRSAKNIYAQVIVFDRGGYVYHGRVKELADGAREGGLQF